MVKIKKKTKIPKWQAISQLVILIAILIAINIIAGEWYQRLDLTKEKRFTLSEATKQMLRETDDIVYMRVYLEGEFPAGFKRLRNSTRDLLYEFSAYAGRNIQYQFINPMESTDPQRRQEIYDELIEKGLQPTNLQVQEDGAYQQRIIFPGAIIFYKGREVPVPLLENQIGMNPQQVLNASVQLLEYKLANGIRKVQQTRKPIVAFVEGQGELEPLQVQDITKTLEELQYDVRRLDLRNTLYVPKIYNLLVVAKPREAFREHEKFKLDQFLMNGGSILWLIDAVNAEMDSLRGNELFFAQGRELNLDDMLFRYGIRINTDLVQDLQSNRIPLVVGSLGDAPQTQLFPWIYFPVATSDNSHAINRNIGPVNFRFANSIDTIRVENIEKTVLLKTSRYSRAVMTPTRIHFGMLQQQPDPERFTKSNIPLAVLLEGEFESVFKGRLTASTQAMLDTLPGVSFRERSDPVKMIVISDGDIIRNETSAAGAVYPLGFYQYTEQTFANKDFILNAIEYLTDNSGLIETRNKEIQLRLLDRTKIQQERTQWQVLNLGVPVVLILLFGFIFNYIRKRRYSR